MWQVFREKFFDVGTSAFSCAGYKFTPGLTNVNAFRSSHICWASKKDAPMKAVIVTQWLGCSRAAYDNCDVQNDALATFLWTNTISLHELMTWYEARACLDTIFLQLSANVAFCKLFMRPIINTSARVTVKLFLIMSTLPPSSGKCMIELRTQKDV